MLHPYYDCIIVGAGISGLYMARELLKAHPTWSIALAERYKGLGGRTYTYTFPKESPQALQSIHWEMGAGRIHTSHTILLSLLKEYGLTYIPIDSKASYLHSSQSMLEQNQFESFILPIYMEPIRTLSPHTLATHTIKELMNSIYGTYYTKNLLLKFPYRSEIDTLRADLALKTFFDNGEMSTHNGYGVIKEGFSELIHRMRTDIEERGCTILPKHKLIHLEKGDSTATDLMFEYGYKEGIIRLRATKCVVLALHIDAIRTLRPFYNLPMLSYLRSKPLLRTYMVFDTKYGPVWFSDLTRIITPARPRYILPINVAKGVIMISYTDGADTTFYTTLLQKNGEKALEKTILADIRALFPKKSIPKPIAFKAHLWETGATYWVPGSYTPEKESDKSIHPLPSVLPNVWLCGESWSLKQAWVEGALEQTKKCLEQLK